MAEPAPRLHPSFLSVPIAHRGLHDASRGIVENSASAFEAAIAAGYGIELDVQMSADGEAMTFHDYELERLVGTSGYVRTSEANALRAMQLSGGTDLIPDLAQTLAQVAGRCPLLIEIKDQDMGLGPNVGPLENRVAELLTEYSGPVAVMSFNLHSVACFAKAAPSIPCGRVTCAFDEWPNTDQATRQALKPITAQDAGGISFVSHDAADLKSANVAKAKAQGLDILCWTIRSREEEAAARETAANITFEGYQPLKPED